jgi:hypothetical protein
MTGTFVRGIMNTDIEIWGGEGGIRRGRGVREERGKLICKLRVKENRELRRSRV